MRRTVSVWCASSKAVGKAGASTTAALQWRKVPFHAWQLQQPASVQQIEACGNESANPEGVFLAGAQAGPTPLLVLDGPSAPNACGADAHLPWLSTAAYRHGALSLQLPTADAFEPKKEGKMSYLETAAHRTVRTLDLMQVPWTHVVGRGIGAYVGALLTWLYPERIGSLVLLDTPLLTADLWDGQQQREELRHARLDVNVPQEMLEDAVADLTQEAPPPLPLAGADLEAQTAVVEKHVYPSQEIFARGAEIRDESPFYLTPEHIAAIRHPALLVTPKENATSDVALHKRLLNVRKHQAIASAASGAAMLAEGKSSAEVGAAVASWIERYDVDAIMKKKWANAAADMRSKMGQSKAAPKAEPTEKAPKKKKEKKGKKQ